MIGRWSTLGSRSASHNYAWCSQPNALAMTLRFNCPSTTYEITLVLSPAATSIDTMPGSTIVTSTMDGVLSKVKGQSCILGFFEPRACS